MGHRVLPNRTVVTYGAVIATAPRHKATLQTCLDSLPPETVETQLVIDHQTTGPGPTFWQCLEIVAASSLDAWLVLQDDAQLSANLDRAIQAGLPPGWLSLYTPAVSHQPDFGWHDPAPRSAGAVAYLVRTELAARFLATFKKYEQLRPFGIDYAVLRWCRHHEKVPFSCHSPSLAQHIGEYRAIHYTSRNRATPGDMGPKRTAIWLQDAADMPNRCR